MKIIAFLFTFIVVIACTVYGTAGEYLELVEFFNNSLTGSFRQLKHVTDQTSTAATTETARRTRTAVSLVRNFNNVE